LHTRANVAYFGTFGYELDLNHLTQEEQKEVKEQIAFMKEYRELLQFGNFYRLSSPFDGNITCWMAVNEEQTQAVVGWYRVLCGVNLPYARIRLQGLDPDFCYQDQETGKSYFGDELMNLGLITSDPLSGQVEDPNAGYGDFDSRLFVLKRV
jgi:alpha-galactosidase